MNFTKVKTGFSQYSDDDLESQAKFILESMTGNTFYPSPVPNLVVLSKAYEDFAKANNSLYFFSLNKLPISILISLTII